MSRQQRSSAPAVSRRVRGGDLLRLCVTWAVSTGTLVVADVLLPDLSADSSGPWSWWPPSAACSAWSSVRSWWRRPPGSAGRGRPAGTPRAGRGHLPRHARGPPGSAPRSRPPCWRAGSPPSSAPWSPTSARPAPTTRSPARSPGARGPVRACRPRGGRRGVRPAGRRPVPRPAVGRPVRRRTDDPALAVIRRLPAQRVDAAAPLHDPGQPARHPARHGARGPGVPVVRPGARAGAGHQPAGGRQDRGGPGQRRARPALRGRRVGLQPLLRGREPLDADDEPAGSRPRVAGDPSRDGLVPGHAERVRPQPGPGPSPRWSRSGGRHGGRTCGSSRGGRDWTFALLRAVSNALLRDLDTALVADEMLPGARSSTSTTWTTTRSPTTPACSGPSRWPPSTGSTACSGSSSRWPSGRPAATASSSSPTTASPRAGRSRTATGRTCPRSVPVSRRRRSAPTRRRSRGGAAPRLSSRTWGTRGSRGSGRPRRARMRRRPGRGTRSPRTRRTSWCSARATSGSSTREGRTG